MSKYVRYSDDLEKPAPDEAETFAALLASMRRVRTRTGGAFGASTRVAFAKPHGAVVGELLVTDGMPEPYRQGLFARSGRYDAIVRLANLPGEYVSDDINAQRGLSVKVLDARGPKLAGHSGSTQDFVLGSSERFIAPDAKAYLCTHRVIEYFPTLPEQLKTDVSRTMTASNRILHELGLGSPTLDFFGSPRVHPLAESYFTQTPLRYGDYVAKLAFVPVAPAQQALEEQQLSKDGDRNLLRTATVAYFRAHEATFDVRVQLNTNLATMPIEDATAEWSEDESPFVSVGRLRIPPQEAFADERVAFVDGLSFCLSHSLVAHRPLGSINRARLAIYPEMVRLRAAENGIAMHEPQAIEEVP